MQGSDSEVLRTASIGVPYLLDRVVRRTSKIAETGQ